MASGGRVHFILITDIARSSFLWEAFPRNYAAALERHNELLIDTIHRFEGEVLKNVGDGFIALFDSAQAAVSAAVAIQRALNGDGAEPFAPFPDGKQLTVRVIVHGGPLHKLDAGHDWFGPALNRAARIAAACHAGQTLISGYVLERIIELPENVSLLTLGVYKLRDIGEAEELYQVNHPSFPVQLFPPLKGGESRITAEPEAPQTTSPAASSGAAKAGHDAAPLLAPAELPAAAPASAQTPPTQSSPPAPVQQQATSPQPSPPAGPAAPPPSYAPPQQGAPPPGYSQQQPGQGQPPQYGPAPQPQYPQQYPQPQYQQPQQPGQYQQPHLQQQPPPYGQPPYGPPQPPYGQQQQYGPQPPGPYYQQQKKKFEPVSVVVPVLIAGVLLIGAIAGVNAVIKHGMQAAQADYVAKHPPPDLGGPGSGSNPYEFSGGPNSGGTAPGPGPSSDSPFTLPPADPSTAPPPQTMPPPNFNHNINIEGYNLAGHVWLLAHPVDPDSMLGFQQVRCDLAGFDAWLAPDRTLQFSGVDAPAGVGLLLQEGSGSVAAVVLRVPTSARSAQWLHDYYADRYGQSQYYLQDLADEWMDGEGDYLQEFSADDAYTAIVYGRSDLLPWPHTYERPLWAESMVDALR